MKESWTAPTSLAAALRMSQEAVACPFSKSCGSQPGRAKNNRLHQQHYREPWERNPGSEQATGPQLSRHIVTAHSGLHFLVLCQKDLSRT